MRTKNKVVSSDFFHKQIVSISLCSCLALFSSTTSASIINGQFSGTVSYATSTDNGVFNTIIPGDTKAGDSVIGAFMYDTRDTSAIMLTSTHALYSPNSAKAISFSIGTNGFIWDFQSSYIQLTVNSPGTGYFNGEPAFNYSSVFEISGNNDPQLSGRFNLAAHTLTPNTFLAGSGTALPTSLLDMDPLYSGLHLQGSVDFNSFQSPQFDQNGDMLPPVVAQSWTIMFSIDPTSFQLVDVSQPPPSTSDLARFSQIAYGDTVAEVTVGGRTYNKLISSTTGQEFGFDSTVGRAIVYSNNNNIVIGFRGTLEEKDVYSDTSWNPLRLPSPNLTQFVASAANLLRDVQNENPGKEITLTGHSLGGAVAQLLGAASGLNTETFNAPGTAELISNLRNALAPVDVNPSSLSITNHRVYGDVVSKAGSEIGDVVTHASPIGEITNSCNTLCSALYNHKISTTITTIENDPYGVSGYPEGIDNYFGRVLLLTAGQGLFVPVVGNYYYLLDPVGTYGQEFSLLDGSPLFKSVAFGYTTDFLYGLALWGENGWYDIGAFNPGDEYIFGADGVDIFRVFELSMDRVTRMPLSSDFIVAVTFTEDGVANLMYKALSVPEPSSIVLTLTCLVFIGFIEKFGKRKINLAKLYKF